MTTFTTIDQIEEMIDTRTDLYVRWSNGPEADAANGWVSRNHAEACYEWQGDELVNIGGGYEEDGLSATPLDDLSAITRWDGQVNGTVCYILSGSEVGECSDGEPLLVGCEPVGFVPAELVAAIRHA